MDKHTLIKRVNLKRLVFTYILIYLFSAIKHIRT